MKGLPASLVVQVRVPGNNLNPSNLVDLTSLLILSSQDIHPIKIST